MGAPFLSGPFAKGPFGKLWTPGPFVQTLDPLTQVYVAAVKARGSTVTTALSALDTLIKGLRTGGLLSKLKCFNPMASDGLAGVAVQLNGATGLAAAGVLNGFVSGDWSLNLGLKGNGSTKYIDCGLTAATTGLVLNNTHISGYCISGGSAYGQIVGRYDGTNAFTLNVPWTGDTAISSGQYAGGSGSVSGPGAPLPPGFICGSRVSATDHRVFKNATQVGANTTVAGTLPSGNIYAMGTNNVTTPQGLFSGTANWYSFGDGVTPAQESALYTLIQAYNTKLGRQV